MNAHTQDSVFGKVDVRLIHQVLVRIVVDSKAPLHDEVWQNDTRQDFPEGKVRFRKFLVLYLVSDRLEIVFEQLVGVVGVISPDSLHVVPRKSPW